MNAAAEPPPFTVHLDRVFHGPLDLLLQLVREKELEIERVALAEVCEAYCHYVREMEQVDVDEAADYLVVAATLVALKSRALLPREEVEADEDLFEPGEELIQQLLAYKELREVAEELGRRWEARARLLPAGGRWLGRYEREEDEEEEEWDLGEVSVWDLLRIFRRLEAETGFNRPHRVRPDTKPLRHYVQEVWRRLQEHDTLSLGTLLAGGPVYREDAASYLVALLELARQRAVDLEQREPFGDILVRRSGERREVDLELLDPAFDEHGPPEDAEVGELLDE